MIVCKSHKPSDLKVNLKRENQCDAPLQSWVFMHLEMFTNMPPVKGSQFNLQYIRSQEFI